MSRATTDLSPTSDGLNDGERPPVSAEMVLVANGKTTVFTNPTSVTEPFIIEEDLDIEQIPERETWDKKCDFLLSIVGFAVDLANVWRFPYLCYKNGGGAFLVPYFCMLLFGALPLFYLELVLGQYHRQGAVAVWARMSPLFKGVGYSMCLMAFYVSIYYNVIIGWSFFYLFHSFRASLPWTSCDNEWNTDRCRTSWATGTGNGVSAAAEFFERYVLGVHRSEGIHDLGAPKWQLVLCTMLVFFILYFSLWKGVKSSGKVVWVTATLPYIVLSVLLIRGCLLPGAGDGVRYFITPKISKLGELEVWVDAAVQIFYSVGAGFGVHIAYASYNKLNNNCYRDCLITACVNSFTSVFSGFVIFCYLGYMSKMYGAPIDSVAKEGPGLVFVVYPEAIATLPGSTAWAVIFFLMLISLGLDSAMGGMESILTGLKDDHAKLFAKYKYSREVFLACIIMFSFLLSIMNVTEGGIFIFTMLDSFGAGTSIIFTVLIQAIGVAWFYGMDQFSSDIQHMLGFKPGLYWRICWKFITPIFLSVIFVFSIMTHPGLMYALTTHTYYFPRWANMIGWMIAASAMLTIPGVGIYKMIRLPGTFSRRFALCISPKWEHKAIKRGSDVKRYRRNHWFSIG
ncbi:sodium-dependent dopamine transporter-like [Tubulanus polymorphus]|uniref:sodium-dependent dopamine transporter-like n=1 Tax=Tubulanus polymorphus TaxID=672921 RepID=UPI003DA359D6